MVSSRNKDRIRYRYGICLNDNCEKCKSKEVQTIPARKDFVCSECGKQLRECPPPKQSNNKKLIIGIVAAVVIIGGIIAAVFSGGGETNPLKEEVTVAVVDSDSIAAANIEAELQKEKARADSLAKVAEEAKKKPAQAESAAKPAAKPATQPASQPAKSSGTKNLGYAIFKGSLKNGQPDDVNGRLIFKTSHVIDSRDSKGRVAEAGDYVIGEFSEGHLVQGIWYDSDNQVKGSVIIGK